MRVNIQEEPAASSFGIGLSALRRRWYVPSNCWYRHDYATSHPTRQEPSILHCLQM